MSYTYDSTETQLLSASGPAGVTRYTYAQSTDVLPPIADAAVDGNYGVVSVSPTDNALTSITNPDGTKETFTYDSQGRLASQAGTGGVAALTYSYPSVGEMTITDALGNKTTAALRREWQCRPVDRPGRECNTASI